MERTKKKSSIHSLAMERTKKNECIRSSTMKQTKKNEDIRSSTLDVLSLLVRTYFFFSKYGASKVQNLVAILREILPVFMLKKVPILSDMLK